MIEIFPISIFSLFIALLTKIFFLGKKLGYRVKMTFHYHHFKSHIPTTYFIIKTLRCADRVAGSVAIIGPALRQVPRRDHGRHAGPASS